jgi:hypothetical protein
MAKPVKSKISKPSLSGLDGFNFIIGGDRYPVGDMAKRFGCASAFSFKRACRRAIADGKLAVDASGTAFWDDDGQFPIHHICAEIGSSFEHLFQENFEKALLVRKAIHTGYGFILPLAVTIR